MNYRIPNMYLYPYDINAPIYYPEGQSINWVTPNRMELANYLYPYRAPWVREQIPLRDYGPMPFVVDINEAAKENSTYRTALWTGDHLQVTLMSIHVGEDIGLEVHPDVDQVLRVEQGQGMVEMGPNRTDLNFRRQVFDGAAIMVPAGTWHNVTNIGHYPLKLYSIYAPPNHPHGTVHVTRADAMTAEEGHGYS